MQKLRRLADKNREESSLEIELEAYLRRRIEEDTLQPRDAAQVMVVLRKGRAGEGSGPSDALAAFLQ